MKEFKYLIQKSKVRVLILGFCALFFTSCNDWLEVYPVNEQVSPRFWQSKEDVEAVLAAGYEEMRAQVSGCLVDWSELRGGSIMSRSNTNRQKMQQFKLTSDNKLCSWASMYKILNYVNSVIYYAPEVQERDETYYTAYMNAHLVEARFLRALTYFYLVRNFKEAPLIILPYVDDSQSFEMQKSSEEDILKQIREDIDWALQSGAAKEFYEDTEWTGATKGRATKWSLYALLADVALWSGDYDACIDACNHLLNAREESRSGYFPAFMAESAQWFNIFYLGNTNEGIFELNWQSTLYDQTTGSPSNIFTVGSSAAYQFSPTMSARLEEENAMAIEAGLNPVRASWGTYAIITEGESQHCVWKYNGLPGETTISQTRLYKDANWIVYRMADVLLMKAEALVWKGGHENSLEAVALMHQVRTRAGLPGYAAIGSEEEPVKGVIELNVDEQLEMLTAILNERDLEFAAEGKRWYDLMRFGRSQNYKYKENFIALLKECNESADDAWLETALSDPYGWYLPIMQSDIESNPLLKQNPYYASTSASK